MLKDILAKLTGRQITLLASLAILAPSAVGAAVTFTAVAIVDPNTGVKSLVDAGRRLWVFDPIAGYRNSPANAVDIVISHDGGFICETSQQYPIPAGKALVITAITGDEALLSTSSPYAGYYVYDGAGCTGNLLTTHISSASSSQTYMPVTVELGSGIVVKAGKTVSVYSLNNIGYTFLHGYLVPAAAAPAAPASAAAYEPKPITAADVAAKMKKR